MKKMIIAAVAALMMTVSPVLANNNNVTLAVKDLGILYAAGEWCGMDVRDSALQKYYDFLTSEGYSYQEITDMKAMMVIRIMMFLEQQGVSVEQYCQMLSENLTDDYVVRDHGDEL